MTPRTILYEREALQLRYDLGPSRAEEIVPAISLHQPWASWVAMGWKTIETRSHNRFASLVGKRVAIHAARTWDASSLGTAEEYLAPERIDLHGRLAAAWGRPGGYPQGELVCVAKIDRAGPMEWPGDARMALCDFQGRVGYRLADVSPLPAGLVANGCQGIFYVSLPELWVRQLPLPLFAAESPA